MSDTRIRESYPWLRATAVVALGTLVVGGLKVVDGLRRIWKGITR